MWLWLLRFQEHVSGVLKDYIDFLHVKIHRNITMTAYLEMYPGLVHFIYVDRTSNLMVAPCLTPGTSGESASPHDVTPGQPETLKQKVWNMHAHAQRRLAQGYTSFTIKAGDFRYAFYIWFESESGEKLVPKKLFRTTRQVRQLRHILDQPTGAFSALYRAPYQRYTAPYSPFGMPNFVSVVIGC